MMAGNAMKEDRLSVGIGQEIGSLDHLVQGRSRAPHGNEEPGHARIGDNLCLSDVLGIVMIDRRQRHDGLDPSRER